MLVGFLKAWYGDFSREELKKFLFLGSIFSLLVGVYWTLRVFKDTFFQEMIGAAYQPYAKWVSLLVMFPLVIAYSKIVERLSREKMFYFLAFVYGSVILLYAYLFLDPTIGLDNKVMSTGRILGWTWYVFVESFGSLLLGALFWAFATDITAPESAKRGFSLVVMIGQIGGILLPMMGRIPQKYNIHVAYMVAVCGILVYAIIPLVKLFLYSVSREQLKGYEQKGHEHQDEVEPGFLEGLRLMISEKYLLGIFAISFFYELIITVIDYYFKYLVAANIPDIAARSAYTSIYASWVNAVTLLCLVLGISNIQRRLGLAVSLGLMPFLIGAAVFMFATNASIDLLLWLMVASKAINYALNGPSLKQLYVPTTKEARYKSQAWIESFGSRGSKGGGSGLNMLHKKFQVWFNGANWNSIPVLSALDYGSFYHILLCSGLFSSILVFWFFIAMYLAKTYNAAVKDCVLMC